jgi:hypothetical protein
MYPLNKAHSQKLKEINFRISAKVEEDILIQVNEE